MGRRRTNTPYIDPRKCPKHNAWKKKGKCELCLMEQDQKQKEFEELGGKHKPPVIIRKL